MSYSPNFRGASAKASRALLTSYQNGSGGLLTQGQPVSVNATGQIVAVDVTDDTSVAGIIGVCAQDIPNAASGTVMDAGRLENITTAFNIGDPIYINTDGSLISIRPDVGIGSFVQGDFAVFVGVIVKNEFNPTQKDLKLYMTVVGQL